MSTSRFFALPDHLNKLLTNTLEAYASLTECYVVKEEELSAFTHKKGLQDYKNDVLTYEINACKILDFYILVLSDVINQIIAEKFAAHGYLETINAINNRFKKYVNPAARYFDNDEAYVPHITSERLFTKMLFVEFILVEIEKSIKNLNYVIKLAAKMYVKQRLKVTSARLDEYAEKNNLIHTPVTEFYSRLTQDTFFKKLKEEFGSQSDDKLINKTTVINSAAPGFI